MYDLEKKIDDYTDTLFIDLGLTNLPEENKADIFARVQDHLHKALLETLAPVIRAQELARISDALEQENYQLLSKILEHYPQYKDKIENKIESEMQSLKLIITEEQKNEQRAS